MNDFVAWFKRQWDRGLAAVAAALGAIALFLGWFGVSGATLTTEQIPFLASGAVAGLFLLGIAATLWLSADLRDEWQKLDDIYQLLQDEADARGQSLDVDPGEDPSGDDATTHTANGRRTRPLTSSRAPQR